MRTRAAFTLIEILAVVAIITVLSCLTISIANSLRFKARTLDTGQRMQAILTALAGYAQVEGSAAAGLQASLGLGGVSRFASLEGIWSAVLAGRPARSQAPWLVKPDSSGQAWAVTAGVYQPDSDEDHMQRDMWKNVFDVLPPATGAVAPTYYAAAWPCHWPQTDWSAATPGTVPPILRFPWGKPGLAANGDVCDPAKPATAVIAKTPEFKDPTVPFDQNNIPGLSAWQLGDVHNPQNCTLVPILNGAVTMGPDSGPMWSCATPDPSQTCAVAGAVTGTRSDGTSVITAANRPLPFDLGWLSPLATIDLLEAAEILPVRDGELAYRGDRSPKKQWNDAWGHPLVVSYALFQPERFMRIADGQNRRDLLLKKSMDAYQYNRSLYAAVGAVGADRTPLASELSALAVSTGTVDDRLALAVIWQRICLACGAAAWNESSFGNAPWKDVKVGSKNGMRALLSSPIEIR